MSQMGILLTRSRPIADAARVVDSRSSKSVSPKSLGAFAMPADFEVTCIRKRQHQNPHERIEAICGRQANGGAWRLSEAEAIAGLKVGKFSLYVSVGGKVVFSPKRSQSGC